MEREIDLTTGTDGSTVSKATELIRKTDGKSFKIDKITKGKGRYGKVTIFAKGRGETLTLSRQDLWNYSVNLSTVSLPDETYDSHLDELYVNDPDGFMQKREDDEIEYLNFRYKHGLLIRADINRAWALGLPWAENAKAIHL